MPGNLNLKKSWHPALMKNQKAVWIKEQEAIEERKKIIEREKEIKKERERNELQDMEDAAKGRSRERKLEWMYSTPGSNSGSGGKGSLEEEYLLGKKKVDFRKLGSQHEDIAKMKKGGDADKYKLEERHTGEVSEREEMKKASQDPLQVIMRRQAETIINRKEPSSGASKERPSERSGDSRYSHRSRSSSPKARHDRGSHHRRHAHTHSLHHSGKHSRHPSYKERSHTPRGSTANSSKGVESDYEKRIREMQQDASSLYNKRENRIAQEESKNRAMSLADEKARMDSSKLGGTGQFIRSRDVLNEAAIRR